MARIGCEIFRAEGTSSSPRTLVDVSYLPGGKFTSEEYIQEPIFDHDPYKRVFELYLIIKECVLKKPDIRKVAPFEELNLQA